VQVVGIRAQAPELAVDGGIAHRLEPVGIRHQHRRNRAHLTQLGITAWRTGYIRVESPLPLSDPLQHGEALGPDLQQRGFGHEPAEALMGPRKIFAQPSVRQRRHL
jgi:hypothetical protein